MKLYCSLELASLAQDRWEALRLPLWGSGANRDTTLAKLEF